jgi:ferric-dicitrate binding protein FerR (iron transport regulator)
LKKESSKYHLTEKFNSHIERKKNQSKEDQYIEAGVLAAEMKSVDTDKAYLNLQAKIGHQHKFRRIYLNFSKVAAILILPLILLSVWGLTRKVESHAGELGYQEISSPIGIRSKIVLPDGSVAWLNAGSKMRYSIPFVCETRELELVGEAFLEVEKNQASPMEIKFNDFKVTVLGTQFNVKAFPDEQHLEVVLKEGSINLANSNRAETIQLKPNQQWVYDKKSNTSVLNSVNADRYVAWHKNRLILNDTPMVEVENQLERWYGIEVEVADAELYNYRFTTVFEDEPIYRVIELLEMSSPIKINYVPGKLNPQSGTMDKSIIKFAKK